MYIHMYIDTYIYTHQCTHAHYFHYEIVKGTEFHYGKRSPKFPYGKRIPLFLLQSLDLSHAPHTFVKIIHDG